MAAEHPVVEIASVPEPAAVEVAEPASEFPKIKTVGFDSRFPNVNQTRNCWQNYVDYFKCVKAKGDDFAPCMQFKRAYLSLCPPTWMDRWDEQREENVFPGLHEVNGASHH